MDQITEVMHGLMFKGPSQQGYAVDQAIDYQRYAQQMAQQSMQGLGNVFGSGVMISTMMAGMANAQNAYVAAEPDYVRLIDEEFRKTGWGRKQPKPRGIELRWPKWHEFVELWRSW